LKSKGKYVMTISRLTVDKLGVKLYDKVSAVLAELVANSYDADATEVTIRAPMGEYLATRQHGQIRDKGYAIEIVDNGIGILPADVNRYYLKVGAERRRDERGDVSQIYKRKVMGRKGVGKLAPFGICQVVEIITSGGERVTGVNKTGKQGTGYLTAHFVLDRESILQEVDFDYMPAAGATDGTVARERGTRVILRGFSQRKVPALEDLSRQLAQRFGVQSSNWKITLIDSTKTEEAPDQKTTVGSFAIKMMGNTEIRFVPGEKDSVSGRAFDASGISVEGLDAGFSHDGRNYPIRGWVGYAKEPYKDDLMAGVRIYCRGKIAAQTAVFNRRAGFTGEHDVRSYLVGELHADWLDEEEDLIQTDRRDILWSHELGQLLEQWGQAVVRKIGTRARDPMKKKTWERFKEKSNIEERVKEAYPAKEQQPLRDNVLQIAKFMGQTMRQDEVEDPERVQEFVQLSLMLGPVITLDEKLREAADAKDSPLEAVTEMLRAARIAELAGFGRIAQDRVRVIGRVEHLKDSAGTLESAFQTLIEECPWLIDPQWSPIAANQTFSTLRHEFVKFYCEQTGEELNLENFTDPPKRADFVMSSQDNAVQIIEIKRPKHDLEDKELDRIILYRDMMQEFLAARGNEEFRKLFPSCHITLVCDGLKLDGAHRQAFKGLEKDAELTHLTWKAFLLKTRRMHQEFLNEAERQRKMAARNA
jgi:Histidine kinase-, DNA gyrase B-, and HSP90-like ATPase